MECTLRMKVSGIPAVGGEDWIELTSLSHSIGRFAPGELQQDLGVTKLVDRASPLLALACAEGWRVREVTLRAVDHRGSFEIRLKSVRILACSVSAGSGGTPMESITFRCAGAEWVFLPEGGEGRAVRARWMAEGEPETTSRWNA